MRSSRRGKTPYDLILSQTDKDLVKMELDLVWAVKAGNDPVKLFEEHPGQFPLWHNKDIKADLKTIMEVGNGVVDVKRALNISLSSRTWRLSLSRALQLATST